MLNFQWLKSRPWRWAYILWWSPSPRNMVAFFLNITEREKWKSLKWSVCNEAITTKPLQSDVVFSYLQLFRICVSSEFKQFSFSLVSFWRYTSARLGKREVWTYAMHPLPPSSFKFQDLNTVWNWNLHQQYSLVNNDGERPYKFGHLTRN